MTRFKTLLGATGLVLAAAAAIPAQAQVSGNIATVDIPGTIISTNAFQGAYKQIDESYKQQIDLLRTRGQERQTLLAKYDKDNNKQVDDAELAALKKSPDAPKIESLEAEMQAITNQLDSARVFAIEQVIQQTSTALDDMVKTKQIKAVLDPTSVILGPPELDISQALVAAINAKPAPVGVVPPAEWKPSQQGVQMFQQINQRLQLLQAIAQQRQAQQGAQQPANPAAPSGR